MKLIGDALSDKGVALIVLVAVVVAMTFAHSVEAFVGFIVIVFGLAQIAYWIGSAVVEFRKPR